MDDTIGEQIRRSDRYGILKDYNNHYGNVYLIETRYGERFYVYSYNGESWIIDAYDLECKRYQGYPLQSRYNRRMMGHAYEGLDIRMYCHEYVEDKLREIYKRG